MKYAVVNLGCKVNRVESDAFASSLDAHGAKSCDAADADLIVVNTCTVTGEAEKKTRKAVRGALRANNRATVIVTGCAAAIDKDTFLAMDSRVRVMGPAPTASCTSHAGRRPAWILARSCANAARLRVPA